MASAEELKQALTAATDGLLDALSEAERKIATSNEMLEARGAEVAAKDAEIKKLHSYLEKYETVLEANPALATLFQ